MARTQDLTVYRGEDITLSGTIYTTDTGSTPEDITGWTMVLTVADDNNPTTTKRIQATAALVLPASGTFTVDVDTADLNLEPGSYSWDLTRTNAGYVRTLIVGDFIVTGVPRLPSA